MYFEMYQELFWEKHDIIYIWKWDVNAMRKMRALLLFLIKILDSIILVYNFYKWNLSDFFLL